MTTVDVARPQVQESILVEVSPQVAWHAIADPRRIALWSPEAVRAEADSTGALGVGERFSGTNRNDRRRWVTSCAVVESTPGEAFAFDVTYLGLRVARWRYRVTAHAEGCLVEEQWWDRRGRVMRMLSEIGTGVSDRPAHNRVTMQQTLRALKADLESGR